MNRTQKKVFYVYVDSTSEGRPFYVGKGSGNRSKQIKRNRKHEVISKKFGFNRTIILETRDENFAFEKEIELIKSLDTFNPDFRDFNDLRCNLTNGGDGASGYRHSEESKKKMSLIASNRSDDTIEKIRQSAKNRPPISLETRKKIGEASKKHAPFSLQVRQKISQANTGKKRSEETKKKLSFSAKNRSSETREKMRISHKGFKHSNEVKQKLREIHTNLKHSRVTCLKM